MSNIRVWEGVFTDFLDVAKLGKGFDGERWLERIAAQLKSFIEDHADGDGQVLPPRPSSLPWLCALTSARSFLDYGGSSGWAWYYLNDVLTSYDIDYYHVMELANIVNYFREHTPVGSPLKYIEQPENNTYDVLYANSALQYQCEDQKFFDLVSRVKPSWVLLEDVLVGDFEDFYSLQLYYDDSIPVKFRNKQAFVSRFEKAGYGLRLNHVYIADFQGSYRPFPMENFPPQYRVPYGQTFLFARSGDDN